MGEYFQVRTLPAYSPTIRGRVRYAEPFTPAATFSCSDMESAKTMNSEVGSDTVGSTQPVADFKP